MIWNLSTIYLHRLDIWNLVTQTRDTCGCRVGAVVRLMRVLVVRLIRVLVVRLIIVEWFQN